MAGAIVAGFAFKHDPDRDLSSLGADDERETVFRRSCRLSVRSCGGASVAMLTGPCIWPSIQAAGRAEGLLKNYVEQALKGVQRRGPAHSVAGL
ncbi:MAG: hypothetical protein R3E89_15950 [Thiolinea sp.]